MALDTSQYTLGEIAKIEDWSKMSIDQIGEITAPKGRIMAALLTVHQRRNGHPKFSFTDALDVPADEAAEILGLGDEEEETEDGADPKGAPSTETEATGSDASPQSSPTPRARAKKQKP